MNYSRQYRIFGINYIFTDFHMLPSRPDFPKRAVHYGCVKKAYSVSATYVKAALMKINTKFSRVERAVKLHKHKLQYLYMYNRTFVGPIHKSEYSLIRRLIGPNIHYSEYPLVRIFK
jgi:hypothetical protein